MEQNIELRMYRSGCCFRSVANDSRIMEKNKAADVCAGDEIRKCFQIRGQVSWESFVV